MGISDEEVIFFLRLPERGMVKTRIAESLGADVALELYRAMVSDTLRALSQAGKPITIVYDSAGTIDGHPEIAGSGYRTVPQAGGDLGERMANAFRDSFSRGCRRAVLVGSDIPELTGAIVTRALESLAEHDMVFGPSRDGGYYLIGFNADRFHERLFQGIPWGTPRVRRLTLDATAGLKLTAAVLSELSDVDLAEDLVDIMERGVLAEGSRMAAFFSRYGEFIKKRAGAG